MSIEFASFNQADHDMADDIEELLREVEEKYLPKQSLALAAVSLINTRIPSQSQQQQLHHHRHHTTSAPPGFYQGKDNGIADGSSTKNRDIVPTTVISKTTTRAHSSEITCRELEDDLSDLLDDDGRMSDAATIGLRCKRSPRRSASARELLVGMSTTAAKNVPIGGVDQDAYKNEKASSSVYNTSSKMLIGNRSAPPSHNQYESRASHLQTNVPNAVALDEKQKCLPIYLSGVIDSIDANQAVRVCSSLRCTGCDFRVSQFAHYRWRPGTDYLFLRNNMPEFDRVRVKLQAAKFCRAYACQCKFITVKDLIDLQKLGPEFSSKWICLGH